MSFNPRSRVGSDFNHEDADHTAAENFDMTAHEVFELLESEYGIENNYCFLEEFADVKL